MPSNFPDVVVVERIVRHAPLGKRWYVLVNGKNRCDCPDPETAERNRLAYVREEMDRLVRQAEREQENRELDATHGA